MLADGSVRCWGYGAYGALGYGDGRTVGVSETPASIGPLDLGGGRTAVAISAGGYHTCAILDDRSVRCWGYGGDGRLGYGNTKNVGTSPASTPGKIGPVDLGPGRTAKSISAGGAHTCAILDDGNVRCWGFGYMGQLGYGNTSSLGGAPATVPARLVSVDLGAGRTAVAISAGSSHTCAILDDSSVRCWGDGTDGRLGYGNTRNVGDTPATIPAKVGAVNLGPGRTAKSISAGGAHTCAILDDGNVRCWGNGVYGQLGYGNTSSVGDVKSPASITPVDIGPGRTAVAISTGTYTTCAILDDGSVRCWGDGTDGKLGYGNTNNVGDTRATIPSKAGAVNLGPARTAKAISAGDSHTCALLDNGTVRCWGYGADGELGYCNTSDVGNTRATVPGKVGSVNLAARDGGVPCAPIPRADPGRLQALRAQAFHRCITHTARRRRLRRTEGRAACIRRYGRTPGRIRTLHAQAISSTSVLLTFVAPGSDGNNPPAARAYLVEQSRHPIRGAHDLKALCNSSCTFNVAAVGTKIKLTITHLAPDTRYAYTVAARDNVSGRLGHRSRTRMLLTP